MGIAGAVGSAIPPRPCLAEIALPLSCCRRTNCVSVDPRGGVVRFPVLADAALALGVEPLAFPRRTARGWRGTKLQSDTLTSIPSCAPLDRDTSGSIQVTCVSSLCAVFGCRNYALPTRYRPRAAG